MTSLQARIGMLAALALVGIAACSVGGADESPTPVEASGMAEETPEERLERVTAITCSPSRRHEALTHGSGAFCAPFDSIPAVDDPGLGPASREELPGREPVVALSVRGRERAYPVRYLLFHEVVNDVVGGVPVVVSFCPLCNSAAAHVRRADGRTLRFGVSGQLENANLVMFDRQTLSRWQQITGSATAGPLRGTELRRLPVELVSFEGWRRAHPDGLVMRRPVEGRFLYGTDPYLGYDADPGETSPFAQGAGEDLRLPPKWRVVGVANDDGAVAFPVPEGRPAAVAEARLGGTPLVALFRFGVAQPEKAETLAEAPPGFAGVVYEARLGKRELDFEPAGEARFRETTTGSTFDVFGRGLDGPLAGRQLEPVPQATAFWFAWAHFHPDTAVAGS